MFFGLILNHAFVLIASHCSARSTELVLVIARLSDSHIESCRTIIQLVGKRRMNDKGRCNLHPTS